MTHTIHSCAHEIEQQAQRVVAPAHLGLLVPPSVPYQATEGSSFEARWGYQGVAPDEDICVESGSDPSP